MRANIKAPTYPFGGARHYGRKGIVYIVENGMVKLMASVQPTTKKEKSNGKDKNNKKH